MAGKRGEKRKKEEKREENRGKEGIRGEKREKETKRGEGGEKRGEKGERGKRGTLYVEALAGKLLALKSAVSENSIVDTPPEYKLIIIRVILC